MTIKKAIGIGLLGASIIGLLAVGIKFNFFNKQNIKTLQTKADIPTHTGGDATTDLTNTTWVLNENQSLPNDYYAEYSINFTSNEINFTTFILDHDSNNTITYTLPWTEVYSFNTNTWSNQVYRTIEITDGTDVTNANLIVWLTNNATLVQSTTTYTITPTFTHLTSSNENYSIAPNGTWTTTLTAESGYSLPKTINVTGATANYNRQTGTLTLSNPTGNVTLTATAVTGNVYETEVIDVRGLMLQILTMPFTFITQAFDVTLWPNTEYEFNIGNFIMAIISIASILFIIKLFTSGFSIIGNYTGSRVDTKLKKSQIEYNKAKTDLARRTDPNTKTRINKKE